MTDIDLTPFCGKDVTRYRIDSPFVRGGYKYATNAYMAVRVKCDEPDTPKPEGQKFPCMDLIFADFDGFNGEFAPWPKAKYEDSDEECGTCNGVGMICTKKCQECNGEGTIECYACGHEKECDECGCDGYVGGEKCTDCNGRGHRMQPWVIKCGENWCRIDNDRAVRTLSNPMFACHGDMILVRFDGGEAVVMRLDYERAVKR